MIKERREENIKIDKREKHKKIKIIVRKYYINPIAMDIKIQREWIIS